VNGRFKRVVGKWRKTERDARKRRGRRKTIQENKYCATVLYVGLAL